MHEHDPLQPHSHDPNPAPPSPDPTIELKLGDSVDAITVTYLRSLPQTRLSNCYIVSTGHGTSGPFTFTGPTLAVFMQEKFGDRLDSIASIEVVSGDGFGTRVQMAELLDPSETMLLACEMNGQPMTREQGLVRLIVPSETDDALRQVKWIGEIRVVAR